MKAAVILLGVIAVFGDVFASPSAREVNLDGHPYQVAIFEDWINRTINSAVAGFAKFDPLDVESQEQALFGHHGEIHNLHAEGFSNIVAKHIKLSLMGTRLDLIVVAPRIFGFVKKWNVDGEYFGSANFDITNVKIKIVAKFGFWTRKIKYLKFTPSIGHANVSIKGIYNNEEASQQVSDFLNVLLNDVINNDKELHANISKLAREILQTILDSHKYV